MRLTKRSRTLLAALLLPLAACSTDRIAAPIAPPAAATPAGYVAGEGLPAPLARYLLERASAGLTYTSESDYPFTWYGNPGSVGTPLTIKGFRAALGIPADVPVEQVDLDRFFGRHIEWIDPYDPVSVSLVPRYENLKATIRYALRTPTVFRVGRIAIDCYIVGYDRAGALAGLKTVAIET